MFLVGPESLSKEVLVWPSIPRFWTIFLRYMLKIYTNLLCSETTLIFNLLNFIWKRSFTVSQNSLILNWWYILHWHYCKSPSSASLYSFTHEFLCLLHAGLVAFVFSFLYLFNNLEGFIIAVCKFLFINVARLFLKYLSFKGTFVSSIILKYF